LIETVEAFCSEHTVSFDEVLYEWPTTKFLAFYEAYARRKVADELSLKRSLEMSAIWGNSNYDTEKDPQLRAKLQTEIDKAYTTAIAGLYGDLPQQQENEIDEDDPFWQAQKRGMEKRKLPATE
jgi:hypothetical protein